MAEFSAGQRLAAGDLVIPTLVGCFFWRDGTIMTTPAGGTETAMTAWTAGSDASVTFRNGRLYRLELLWGFFDSANESFVITMRLRKNLNSTTAQQLGFFRSSGAANGTQFVFSDSGTCYVRNVSGADITCTPGLTVARAVGTGTVSLFGDNNLECSVSVYDVGSVSDPGLAGRIACSVAIV